MSTKAIGYLIDRTQKKLKLSITRRLQELGVDITVEQWVILDLLNQEKSLNQNDIADKTFKDAPNVSRIINLLVKKGLAKRVMDETDRRRFLIDLTPLGTRIVRQLEPEIEEIREKSWQGLNETDYANFVRMLDQIYNNLNEASAPLPS